MAKRHSEGASGGFRSSKQNISRIKAADGRVHEYQVGPRNVKLDGSNYFGAAGANFDGIIKAVNMSKTNKVQVAVLMRRYGSGSAKSRKKGGEFHWYQSKTRVVSGSSGLLASARYAQQAHFNEEEFAEALLGLEYPVSDAITWRIVEVYE